MKDILDLLKVLSGYVTPLVVLIIAIKYYKPFLTLAENLGILKAEKGDTKVEIHTKPSIIDTEQLDEADAEKLIEIGEKAKKMFQQGKPYDDHTLAFADALQFIKNCLIERKQQKSDEPVKIKFITVAMTYSWNELVRDRIPLLMKDFGSERIHIDVVFCDPEYLRKLLPNSKGPNWAEESEKRITEFREFAQEFGDFGGRLSFQAKTYTNLPHWHGVLVEGKYLFLGRSNWEFNNTHPKLKVGQNKYRYFDGFDDSNPEGNERIELFKNWHKYYSEVEWVSSFTIVKNKLLHTYRQDQT